jgi:Protein of unknown function (DUF2283)
MIRTAKSNKDSTIRQLKYMKHESGLEALLRNSRNGYAQVTPNLLLVLVDVLPELTGSLISALQSEGISEHSEELKSATIERWTYDKLANAGYIYLRQEQPIQHGECSVAKTVAFASPEWFNVDFRSSGQIVGIELLSGKSIFEHLAMISFA